MSKGNLSETVSKGYDQRIAILIDVQNMFYSAKILHHGKVDYQKLREAILADRMLVRAIAYIVQKPGVNQSGFHDALQQLGYELRVKELKIRGETEDKRGTAKGSWDVGLTVDALTMAPKLDTVALVTGDGDYVPLVECLKAQGCRVEIYSFEKSTAGELIKAADQYIPIPTDWVFKEKKFEENANPVVPGIIDGDETPQEGDGGGFGILGSTENGRVRTDGLPKDD